MDRDSAYLSSIPEDAFEKVVKKFNDGSRMRSEYYIGKELIGRREFNPDGIIQYEWSFRDGRSDGWEFGWHNTGELLSARHFENGVEHGTAFQWAKDGRLIGSYTMKHGTGVDLWWQDWEDGKVDLTEARYYVNGLWHGFEWWFCHHDQLSSERHWKQGELHGIEREWNYKGGLTRCFPRYWLNGERVKKPKYVRACVHDVDLPPFRVEENKPQREIPPYVAIHLLVTPTSKRSS